MADPRPLTRAELAEFLPSQRAIRAFEKLFQLVPDDLTALVLDIENSSVQADSTRSLVNGMMAERQRDQQRRVVHVSWLSDFPRAVSGVIILAPNVTYLVSGTVDLLGARLVCSLGTAIIGPAVITSTGLAGPLVSSSHATLLQSITLSASTAFNLVAGSAGLQLAWYGVEVQNCSNVGSITGYEDVNIINFKMANSNGLDFGGSSARIRFFNSFFDGNGAGSMVSVASTATVSNSLTFNYCNFISPAGTTALDVSTLASISTEGYTLDHCTFTGAGTYLAGVLATDSKTFVSACKGITNTATAAGYYMRNNATATTIAATSTPVKVAGTTTVLNLSQRFTTTTTNRSTYTGTEPTVCKISAVATLTGTGGDAVTLYIALNGAVLVQSAADAVLDAPVVVSQTAVSVSSGNYIEVWIENNTATNNITVSDLNVIIEGLE